MSVYIRIMLCMRARQQDVGYSVGLPRLGMDYTSIRFGYRTLLLKHHGIEDVEVMFTLISIIYIYYIYLYIYTLYIYILCKYRVLCITDKRYVLTRLVLPVLVWHANLPALGCSFTQGRDWRFCLWGRIWIGEVLWPRNMNWNFATCYHPFYHHELVSKLATPWYHAEKIHVFITDCSDCWCKVAMAQNCWQHLTA